MMRGKSALRTGHQALVLPSSQNLTGVEEQQGKVDIEIRIRLETALEDASAIMVHRPASQTHVRGSTVLGTYGQSPSYGELSSAQVRLSSNP